MADPLSACAGPLSGLEPERAGVLRAAIANSVLEGWAPTAADAERLAEVADGAVPLASYLDGAVERALAAATEVGSPDCEDAPRGFPDTLYPGTGVLRNRFGIRDADALRQLEFEIGTAQELGIETGTVALPPTYDGAHLRSIHRALFGTLYPWAGEFRRYDMALRDNTFHSYWIERYLEDAAHLLRNRLPHQHVALLGETKDRKVYAYQAAEAYAYLNCAHPFREGNGRSSKTLLQLLAAKAGYRLDFAAVSKRQWDTASHRSAPEHGHYRPDAHPLFSVFTAITTPLAVPA
ncbi:Fic family protein [Tsukamurella sp. 1534]|uniref:Fic family protein n=1 Tax=Tsukamurella sp. 1534 TaxID=1151061 RepID=UPI0002DFC538|nr:Fic family protein [Tsukamurella sp. 1534]